MTKPEDKLILIVDDEPDVVSYFKSLLEDAGFKVETASNGFDAIEKVKVRKDTAKMILIFAVIVVSFVLFFKISCYR